MIREFVYLLFAAASIVISTPSESRVSIPIEQNNLVGYQRKISNEEHELNAKDYLNSGQWRCGGGGLERFVALTFGCWDKLAEVNMCCSVHDDCYALQLGKDFCDLKFCSCLNETLKWIGYGSMCFEKQWTGGACLTVKVSGGIFYKPYKEGYVDTNLVTYVPALNKTVEDNYMKLYETCKFMNVTFSNCAYNHMLCYMRILPDRNAQTYENCVDNLITCLDESTSILASSDEQCLTQVEITMKAIADNSKVSGIPTIREAKYPKLQMMICLSMLLVVPFLVSDMVCPGDKETEIRVQLISASFVTSGIATLLQTTFGMRLAILHGPSFAYLPVLNTFQTMYPCNEHTDTSLWQQKIQMISGSCLIAVLVMPLFGFTGIIGFLSKFIGPITIVPIISLLTISAVPDVEQKMSLHWMSSVEFLILVVFIVLLEHWEMPLPAFSFSEKRFHVIRKKVLSQFPYIIGIGIGWFICFILTVTNAIPINSSARTDQNSSIETLRSTPWFHFPIPGQYGTPTINVSLLCGFIASSFVAMIESIGDYNLCAQLSKQGRIPESNLNRGFVVEGIGCMLSSSFGIGTGITTYAENIAIMSVTKVASRITMQVAGVFLLVAGIFSKFSAVLAMIPEPVVGGVLAIGICMVNGVMLRNLLTVDLRLSRNLTIMGISIIMGLTVALHFENNPLKSGNQTVDNVFGTLLTIRMLIGGIIAFTLDNITPGATREQRGFRRFDESGDDDTLVENNGYALPSFMNRFFLKYRWLTYIPLVPSRDEIMDIEEKRMEIKYKL